MKDTDKFINVADLKRKLRYIFKQYGVPKCMQEIYLDMIKRLPYSIKGQLEQTLDTDSKEEEAQEIEDEKA